MSHLIEEYAKSLGVKIGKPFLLDHYFPVTSEKYITIHCDSKIDSKNYEYFPQVINLLKPILHEHGYKIFQIGGQQDPKLKNVDEHFLHLNYKQSCFIIKNSKLHIGIDSLPVHIASLYNIPIVSLYSHIFSANAYPYWSDKDKLKIIEADRGNKKPSYSYEENPKTIRSIKPECIAQSALDLLNIKEDIKFLTLYIGEKFHAPHIEIVPNFMANLENVENTPIYIRADLHFDEQKLAFWCSRHKVNIITNQKISPFFLKTFSQNILNISFLLRSQNFEHEYLKEILKTKIKFNLITEDEKNFSTIKNKFFDYKVDLDKSKLNTKNFDKIKGYFLSNKIFMSESNIYPSEAHFNVNKKLDTFNEVIYDDETFWKDVEHFYIYDLAN